MAGPRNDCRATLRYLKAAGLAWPRSEDFASLADQSDEINRFIKRRQDDEKGGEGGERIRQITSRPVFKVTSGRYRGGTWFDTGHPPQDIVWLLGMEWHDDRAKGSSDAYDVLADLEAAGTLFPQAIDYKRLELDRRRWDVEHFADDARADALGLVRALLKANRASGTIANIAVGATLEKDDLWVAYFSVSEQPITGARSGLQFPLTPERFDLVRAAVEKAILSETGNEGLSDTSPQRTPLMLPPGRPFFVMFDHP